MRPATRLAHGLRPARQQLLTHTTHSHLWVEADGLQPPALERNDGNELVVVIGCTAGMRARNGLQQDARVWTAVRQGAVVGPLRPMPMARSDAQEGCVYSCNFHQRACRLVPIGLRPWRAQAHGSWGAAKVNMVGCGRTQRAEVQGPMAGTDMLVGP